MKLKFNHIDIENFLSIGEAHIDLNNQGFVQIIGKNNNKLDNSLSNGSGKSSLFEALVWCLTGETIRGVTNNVCNTMTEEGTVVTLYFDVDDKSYTVMRSRNHSVYDTNLKIHCDKKDVSGKGIRDSEKILAQLLPDLTSSLIGSVIVLGQGLPQRFSNNNPSGRKDVLEKLSKSDFMIEDLKARIAKRASELNDEMRKLEDEQLVYATQRENLCNCVDSDTYSMSCMSDIETIKKELDEIIKTLKNIDEIFENHGESRKSLLEQREEVCEQLNTILSEQDEAITVIDNRYKDALAQKSETVSVLRSKIISIKDKIKEIDNIKDICPTCGQKLGVVKPDATPFRDALQKLNAEFETASNEHKSVTEQYNSEIENCKNSFVSGRTSLEQERARIDDVLNNLASVENTMSAQRNDLINQYHNKSIEVEKWSQTYNMFQERIKQNKEKIEELSKKILYNTNEQDICKNHIDIISKFKTYASRDFRGYLLTNVINYINKKAKEYAQIIFNNEYVNFELKGNNIEIEFQGKSYENLSGGERQKIDLIVQLSIRDMLCDYLNFSSNILVVDEIFDNLDAIGCDKVINMISDKLRDISSVFIITHHAALNMPYDREITVIKNNQGISSVA